MIGMDKKPFHVMRFKKSLNRYAAAKPLPPENKTTPITPVPTPPAMAASNSPTITTSSEQSMSSSSSNLAIDEQTVSISGISRIKQDRRPSKEFLTAMEKTDQSLRSTGSVAIKSDGSSAEGDVKILFLPPYLQENSDSKDFGDLVDDQTPIQRILGPCPFLPGLWDPERKELIRKYASIYGKNFNKRQKDLLTPFEEQVNEGAYQLCLRDPTLLVRREELFMLSKRAVKEGARYYHGLGKDLDSTIAMTGQKRPRPILPRPRDGLPSPKMLITSDLVDDDIPKKMSGRMRQEKMAELERLIATNKTQQAAKLVELEQAQQLCNFSMAFSIQLEVESLGNACQQLQTSYGALKRKQRRSDRYYTLKERENEDESGLLTEAVPAASSVGTSGNTEPGKLTPSSHGQKRTVLFRQASGVRVSNSSKVDVSRRRSRPTVTAMVIPGAQSPLPPTPPTSSSSAQGVGSSLEGNSVEDEDREVQDLVKNVSHATDEVNSIMIREFQKQLVWDL